MRQSYSSLLGLLVPSFPFTRPMSHSSLLVLEDKALQNRYWNIASEKSNLIEAHSLTCFTFLQPYTSMPLALLSSPGLSRVCEVVSGWLSNVGASLLLLVTVAVPAVRPAADLESNLLWRACSLLPRNCAVTAKRLSSFPYLSCILATALSSLTASCWLSVRVHFHLLAWVLSVLCCTLSFYLLVFPSRIVLSLLLVLVQVHSFRQCCRWADSSR